MDEYELLTIDQLAAAWSVKVSWIYDMVQKGEIPSIKVGGHRRFRPSALASYLDGLEKA